jgi:hypothetical protein
MTDLYRAFAQGKLFSKRGKSFPSAPLSEGDCLLGPWLQLCRLWLTRLFSTIKA